jgi:tight adherence protein C
MNHSLLGALIGIGAAAGLLLAAWSAPPARTIRLVDRIAPYLADAPAPSSLLDRRAEPFLIGRRLLGPLLGEAVGWIDRLVGGAESVRRRLGGLGDPMSVEEFRVEQVIAGVAASVSGALLVTMLTAARGAIDPLLVLAGAGLGAVVGVLGRDWWLTRQVERRERAMMAEFPVIADLLALAVLAGEAPVDAMQRVCRTTRGELTRDIQSALDEANAGRPMTKALARLAERTTLESFGRFIEGMVVAIERGTPLADVLRAQAADVREQSKRSLLETGGRKEVQMMVPVVFMILPITVLFALYPGLVTLVSLAR